MKNGKGQTLGQPYLDLAMKRRDQQGRTDNQELLIASLIWKLTIEGEDLWFEVNEGNSPEIPASSLAELEAWRKAKLIDYKTMYEDLLDKLEFYKKAFEGLKTTVEQNLHTAELQTTERNYVWEAALAAMQGFIASYAGAAKNPDIDTVAGISLTYAESLVAEGKKRNHI